MQAGEQVTTGRPLILGVGNLLLGDEGIGVLAAERLAKTDLAGLADIVDGGTGGFHLLSYLQEYARIILIDAAADGKPPGTITVLQPRFASDFPRSLSAHDIGLRDLFETAALLGELPRIELITISIEMTQSMGLEISDPVRAALPGVEAIVRRLAENKGNPVENR
jgi:hydrogenase maturation protease